MTWPRLLIAIALFIGLGTGAWLLLQKSSDRSLAPKAKPTPEYTYKKIKPVSPGKTKLNESNYRELRTKPRLTKLPPLASSEQVKQKHNLIWLGGEFKGAPARLDPRLKSSGVLYFRPGGRLLAGVSPASHLPPPPGKKVATPVGSGILHQNQVWLKVGPGLGVMLVVGPEVDIKEAINSLKMLPTKAIAPKSKPLPLPN